MTGKIKELEFTGDDLYLIVRALDRVQLTATSNFLSDADVFRVLRLYDFLKEYCQRLYVEAIGAYSYQGSEYPCWTSVLLFSGQGGRVKRVPAPEMRYGEGSRYKAHLIGVIKKICIPAGYSIEQKDDSNLILCSPIKRHSKQLKIENSALLDTLQTSLFD